MPNDRKRLALPALVVIWQIRIDFIRRLLMTPMKDPKVTYKNRMAPTITLHKLLLRDYVDLFREAKRLAKESTVSRVCRVGSNPAGDFPGEVVEHMLWYAGDGWDWREEDGCFPLPKEPEDDPSAHAAVAECERRVKELLARLNLDGFRTTAGKTANVPWLRYLVFLNLDCWANDATHDRDFLFRIPYRIVAAIASLGDMQSSRLEEKRRHLLDLIGKENIDTYPQLNEALAYCHSSRKVVITIPEYYDFAPSSEWKMEVTDLFSEAVEGHLNHRRRLATQRRILLRPSVKRNPHHLDVLIAYQVLLMGYRKCTLNTPSNSPTAAKAAIVSSADLIGLPLRAPKNSEPDPKQY